MLRRIAELGLVRSWRIVPWFAVPLAAAYLWLSQSSELGYVLKPLTLAAAFGLAVIGLDLLFGVAGQLNLGHAVFFAMGAYGTGALSGPDHGWPPLAALAASVAAAALLAAVLGRILLRLEGFYFLAATLGLGLIGENFIRVFSSVTGGEDGIAVTDFSLGGFAFDTELRRFVLAWSVLLVGLVLARNYRCGRRGLAARALAQDERVAQAQGVDVVRLKTEVFVLSAIYAAVGGALLAHLVRYASPTSFGLFATIDMLVAVVLGGAGLIVGPLVAAVFLRLLPVVVESVEEYYDIVNGLVLIVLLLVLPPSRSGAARPPSARRRSPSPQAASAGRIREEVAS